MGAKFLNIELEVRSSVDLSNLVVGLGNAFVVNFCDRVGESEEFLLSGNVVLPSMYSEQNGNPEADEIGNALCSLIEELKLPEKSIWQNATDRVFDIGLEANLDSMVVIEIFNPTTLKRIAELGARLAISVYALEIGKRLS